MKFTACYTKLEDGFGYMGQLLEWTNVITSGKDIDECEEMLKDAAREMALAYYEDGEEIPQESLIVKPIDIPLEDESFMNEHASYHDILSKGKGMYIALKQDEVFSECVVKAICKEVGISADILDSSQEEEEIS